jgi:hypothetical protein
MSGRDTSRDAIQGAVESLVEAGFRPRTARILVRFNRWVSPVALIVSVTAIVLIGFLVWPDLDAARWQAWADENPGFFATLTVGDTVAIVPGRHSHFGIVITRTSDGVRVERHLWFRFDETPVVLVVAPDAADRWLRLEYEDPGFWRQWHSLAVDLGIHLYLHSSQEEVFAMGYEEFLLQLRRSLTP